MDKEFLAKLQEKCANTDTEFENRVQARLEEIEAVQDTIEILNSDESFADFDKTSNSFLQVSSFSQEQVRRAKAAAVLEKAASQTNQPKLALNQTTAFSLSTPTTGR